MTAPTHHTMGPHVDGAYLRKTIAVSYAPWRYVRGGSIRKLRTALTEMFDAEAFLFSGGREALLAVLKAVNLKVGEEVIVQGYTCVVVPNAVHAAGGTAVYADIDPESLNLTADTVRPLITERTRAVVCQHTFGIPANTEELRRLCDEHGILLIEELAHVLPDTKGPVVGRLGDFLILSFGRDKAISGIEGGAVIARREDAKEALRRIEETATLVPWLRVLRLLEYPSRMHSVIRRLSGWKWKKVAIKAMNLLGSFVPVLTKDEKRGRMSPVVHRIPNACAALALYSLKKLPALNERRRLLSAFFAREAKSRGWPAVAGAFREGLPLQKFPLFFPNAEIIRKRLLANNIHLDDGWTGCVICPPGVCLPDAGYEWGTDPQAEAASKQILSLPTHPTMTMIQAQRLCAALDEALEGAGAQ